MIHRKHLHIQFSIAANELAINVPNKLCAESNRIKRRSERGFEER